MNFSDNHATYYSNDALYSLCHPDLMDAPPQTESAVAMKKRKAKAKQHRRKSQKRRGDRLSTFDMCQLVQAKPISSCLELVSLVATQVREGKTCWPNLLPTGEVKRSVKRFSSQRILLRPQQV